MQGAFTQRVSSNAGREKEHILAEFAYQPAAQGPRQEGLSGASNGEVLQLSHMNIYARNA